RSRPDERGPAAVLGDVDPARGELSVADERLHRAPVLELDGAAAPARRLDLRDALEQLLRAVVELALDVDAVVVWHERGPATVHEQEAVPRRRSRPLDEARSGEVPVPGLSARERAVEGEERHARA